MLPRTLPALLILLGACASTPPEPQATPDITPATRAETTPQGEALAQPDDAPSGCDWRVQEGRAIGPEVAPEDDYTQQLKAVDLDGQAPEELIVNVGGCGNHGDCMHVLLQACDATTYRALWGPDYAQELSLEPRSPQQPFATLMVGGRSAQAGCALPLWQRFAWTQGPWEEFGPACANASSDSLWDDAECGARPPICPSP